MRGDKLYVLITGARDEAKYLPRLFESVLGQTVKPVLWVIVNHCSRDDSATIISRFAQDKDWIKVVTLEDSKTNGIFNPALPLHAGFNFTVDYLAKNDISYQYLGVLDADIVLEPDYYKKLIHFMESSPELGIASGRLYIIKHGHKMPEDSGNLPRGGCRLYRRRCFEDIGGSIPVSDIWDTETDILAELRGWRKSVFDGARGIHGRVTHTRRGILRGYWRLGRCHYYAHNHPVTSILTGLLFTVKPPFIYGLVFIASYLKSWLTKGERTQDQEIRDYYRKSFNRFIMRTSGRIFRRSGK